MKFKSEVQLEALNNATVDTDKFLVSDSSAVKYRTGAQVLSDIGGQAALTNPITGTGTLNYVSKFTSATTLGNSQIFDNGTNVLIGTTTDGGYKLDVNGGIRTILGYIRGANSNADINLDGSVGSRIRYGGQSVNLDSANVSFRTSSTERMRITSGGNVGIGTTSPGVRFVNMAASFVSEPTLGSGTVGSQALISANGLYGMYSGVSASGAVWHQVQRNDGNTAVYNLIFQPSGGNVGIGTTAPTAKLQVIGAAGKLYIDDSGVGYNYYDASNAHNFRNFAGTSRLYINTSTGNVGIGTTSPSAKLELAGVSGEMIRLADSSTVGNPFISFFQTSTRRSYIQYVDSGDNLTLASEYGGIVLMTGTGGAETEKMRITSSGDVGIGTTAPSEKLDVAGVIRGVYQADPGGGAVTGKFLAYSPSTYGLVFRGYDTGAHSIQVQREANDAETFPLVLQPLGGNVGIGTDSPNAILDVAGDASINRVTIGQGPVVGQQNTALGKGALSSMVYASANIAIGDSCNTDNDATGLTTIGVELNADTNLDSLNQDCLAISQYNSNAYSNQVPHIYAPKPIAISSGATNIITFDVNHYAGAIVEYMIRLNDGGDYAVGTVYMGWKSNGTGNMIDVRQIEYSDMSGFVFSLGGSGQTLVLTNTSGNNAWIRITVRGMMTN